jgi:uncharacterized beta-barrel protein YwiB (DUF1934 family)
MGQAFGQQKVFIHISGNPYGIDKMDQPIELITEGTLTRAGDAYMIEYDESELSGLTGTRTIIQVIDQSVFLRREGSYPSQMFFEQGKKYVNIVDTPYGELEMGVFATRVDCHVNDMEGDVRLDYLVDISGRQAGLSWLTVSYSHHIVRKDLSLDNTVC